MTKYRVRLPNGRVIGPFSKTELFELKAKGHIKGSEEGQIYPTGAWVQLSELDIYQELMDEGRTSISSLPDDKTFAINLDQLRNQRQQKEIEELVEDPAPVIQESMTETIRIPTNTQSTPVQKKPEPSVSKAPEIDLSDDVPEGLDDDSKTLINPVAQQEIEKMRKAQREEEARLASEEADRQREMAIQKIKSEEEAKLAAIERGDPDALTQVIRLDGAFKKEVLEVAKVEDRVLRKQQRAYDKKKREAEAEDEEEEDDETSQSEEAKKKRTRLIAIIGIFALLYAFLAPHDDSEKQPPFQNVPPQIVFPIPFDKADKGIAQVEYDKGVQLLSNGTYVDIVKAGLHFKTSYENDYNNMKAINAITRAYGEQLIYSKKVLDDGHTLFNFIQSKRPFLLQNPNGVMGLNLFYMAIGKYDAAVDVVERFLNLNRKDSTQELFAVYLQSLMKSGKLVKSKEFFTALQKANPKNQYTLEALIDYSNLNGETDKALEYASEGIKKYPQLVRFYLMKAEMQIKKMELKEIEALLKQASLRNLEYNDRMRAKYLEILGMYTAIKGKVKEATVILRKSLELVDSNDLRMRLAELTATDATSPDAEKLIQESKAFRLIAQAKELYEKKSYELSLSSAAKATEIIPSHIPSELFLSQVQLRLGLAQQALNTLEKLVKLYPDNKDANLALIQAYIDTYKFNEAQTRIAVVSATEIRNTWEYASVNARLFISMGDPLRAIGWLKTSINLNPLNDKDIFLLADILLKRSDFNGVRTLLSKCMELDPINPDYRIAYAKMIYETQDDKAAIGYLLGLQDEFGENPKFLGEMAIFYFRAGRVKEFQEYKKKLEALPVKDKALYEFLLKAALLDERYDEIPMLVEKLIEIEPGDLESMMTAGRVLFENGKLVDSARWFKRVQQKLPSYPKVQYFVARIYYLSGDFDGALKEVEKDIKDNGESDTSLVFMGEIYTSKNELVTAENYYKKAQKINPRSYEALVGLADISVIRNNYDLALDLYKKASKERSDEPVIQRKIGDVYRLLGQGTLAIEAYKLYLEMDPEAKDKPRIDSYIQLMQ